MEQIVGTLNSAGVARPLTEAKPLSIMNQGNPYKMMSPFVNQSKIKAAVPVDAKPNGFYSMSPEEKEAWLEERGKFLDDYIAAYKARGVHGDKKARLLWASRHWDETIFDRLPQRPVPVEYLRSGASQREDGTWVNVYGSEIPAPPEEWIEDADKSFALDNFDRIQGGVQGIAEIFIGESFAHPVQTVMDLMTGDAQVKEETVHKILDDLLWKRGSEYTGNPEDGSTWNPLNAGLVFFVGPGGKATTEMLKGAAQGAVMAPRVIWKKALEALPEEVRNTVKKRLAVGEAMWEKIIVPAANARFIPTYEGKKSIAEIWQPAVERLEKRKVGKTTMGAPFRDAQAQKMLTTSFGEKLGKLTAGMGPVKRFQIIKQLRGLGETEAGAEVEGAIKTLVKNAGLRPSYEKSFRESLAKQMQKDIGGEGHRVSRMGDETLLSMEDDVLGQLDQFVSGQGNLKAKDIQKSLMRVLEDETLDPQVRLLAREMYNVPFDLPKDVAEASRQASTAFLVGGLKRTGQMRSVITKEDLLSGEWIASKHPALKGAYVLRDTDLELKALQDIPKMANQAYQKWFMTPWKTMKTVLRPASHIRNTFSNMILNDFGGLSFMNVPRYWQAFEEMRKGGKYWREWQKLTGGGGAFSLSEIQSLTSGLRFPSNMFDHSLALFDKFAQVPRKLYGMEEQWSKMAMFIHQIEKYGKSPREAALEAMKYTFNYGEITRATGMVKSYLAPFFTWQSKVLPLMAETAVKHPVRLGKWMVFYNMIQQSAIQNTGMSEEEWNYIHSILPDYIQDGAFLLIPWRDEKNRLQMLNLSYLIPGFGDVSEIGNDPTGWLLGNPLYSLGGAIRSKTKYGGAPLYYDWEEPQVKAAKTFSYLWEQMIPSWMPGGIDWNSAWDSVQGKEEALTFWQQVGAGSGFKLKPIDPVKAIKSRRVLDQIHRTEMGSQMKKDLKEATSNDDVLEILDRYSRLKRDLNTSNVD